MASRTVRTRSPYPVAVEDNHDGDASLRPARDRRADRGPVGVRPRRRGLLRGDGVEPHTHTGGPAFLPVRDPGGAAAPAGKDAPPPGGGLARARQSRLLSRPRGRARDAHRADRGAIARDGGAHIAREIGLGLLGAERPGDYEAIALEAEAA